MSFMQGPRARFKALPRWKRITSYVIGTLLALSFIGSFSSGEMTSGAATTPEATTKTEAPKKTAAPKPSKPALTPEQTIKKAIEKKTGSKSNFDKRRVRQVDIWDDGVVNIQLNGDENISEGLTKDGVRSLMKDVIEVAQDLKLDPKELRIMIWYQLVDQYGQEFEHPVLTYGISGTVLKKINTEYLYGEDLDGVADQELNIHPAFKY